MPIPQQVRDYWQRYRMPPLDAIGMPRPGNSFLNKAVQLGEEAVFTKKTKKGQSSVTLVYGDKLAELYARALREPGFTLDVPIKKGQTREAMFIPGHIWGQYMEEYQAHECDIRAPQPPPVDGPHPARVMVVSKIPWVEEAAAGRNMVGPSGAILLDCLRKLRFKGMKDWYVTNVVKFVPPTGNTAINRTWLIDCAPLLVAEMKIVRPEYILLLGADAAKAVIGPHASVNKMEGQVIPVRIPLHDSAEQTPEWHEAKAMVVLHPGQVAREEPMRRQLERGLLRFRRLINGVDITKPEDDLDHRVIYTLEDAQALIREVEAELRASGDKLIAWDAEWQGDSPYKKNAWLRTIQFSWAHKKAVCFVIRDTQGKIAFLDKKGKPALKRLAKLLSKFAEGKRVAGHFLTADMEWLIPFGLDLRPGYEVPVTNGLDGTPAFLRCRNGEGGMDVAAMAHAVEETGMLGLEVLASRYTSAPPYTKPLDDYLAGWCKANKVAKDAIPGYGIIPDEIICPYGNMDADVTRRLAVELQRYLDQDYQGNCCWEAFWDTMQAFNAIADMRQNGLLVDQGRLQHLSKAFNDARDATLARMRQQFSWPEFNPRSVDQVKEALFGEILNGKQYEDGRAIRLRPEGALSLNLTPIKDTGKPPRQWSWVVENGRELEHSPHTGKESLSALIFENKEQAPYVETIRDFRFLDQVVKSVLRPPKTDKEGAYVFDDDGNLVYVKGLAACIGLDGRVHGWLSPTADTGRWKSSNPPLQNLSKTRDDDYVRLLGKAYTHSIRSVFRASPGHVLIEADYKGAELLITAISAGDEAMIDHVFRNQLPDGETPGVPKHPDYYDIHSAVAVLAFRLKCEPTKAGLAAIGKKKLRNIAKTVIFGLMYGRQAKAIALAAREQGVSISVEEAQAIIDAIYAMYPRLRAFFQACEARAVEERWLCNCFGRYRRFAQVFDDRTAADFGRIAMNYIPQSTVASCLNRGLGWLRYLLRENKIDHEVKLALSIHDAVLMEAPIHLVDMLCHPEHGLIKEAMCNRVPIFPAHLDGTPTGTGPYYMGSSMDVCEYWGEVITIERARELGIDPRYAHAA